MSDLNEKVKMLIGELMLQVVSLQLQLEEKNALRQTKTPKAEQTIARKRPQPEATIDPCADTGARSSDGVAPRG